MQMGYVHISNSCTSWKLLRCINCAGTVQKWSKSGRKCARSPIFLSLREREEIEKKRKEYYETHMKEETERLNTLVGWYLFKLKEIREAPVDDRPRMLERLYQISKKNKHLGVTITRAGLINLVNYPEYPPELEIPEYKSLDCVCLDPCRIHKENHLVLEEYGSDHPVKRGYDQLNNFKKLIKAYDGRDSNAVIYLKKVKNR